MSDEWFYGSRGRSQGRENWLWVIVIVFMIMNVGVLSYFTFFRAPGSASDVDALNAELDSLRFQLSSAQAEIDSLKEEIRIGQLPSDADDLILTQLYNRTRNSVVLISVLTSSGGGTGSGFVYDKEGR
ncbi:hypothetical protein KAT55_07685, partial [Candidatus Bathyarchaeota archaeon]|nr:hypothetical protein [Candidatus Bathyarchaeota archaeon]